MTNTTTIRPLTDAIRSHSRGHLTADDVAHVARDYSIAMVVLAIREAAEAETRASAYLAQRTRATTLRSVPRVAGLPSVRAALSLRALQCARVALRARRRVVETVRTEVQARISRRWRAPRALKARARTAAARLAGLWTWEEVCRALVGASARSIAKETA